MGPTDEKRKPSKQKKQIHQNYRNSIFSIPPAEPAVSRAVLVQLYSKMNYCLSKLCNIIVQSPKASKLLYYSFLTPRKNNVERASTHGFKVALASLYFEELS